MLGVFESCKCSDRSLALWVQSPGCHWWLPSWSVSWYTFTQAMVSCLPQNRTRCTGGEQSGQGPKSGDTVTVWVSGCVLPHLKVAKEPRSFLHPWDDRSSSQGNLVLLGYLPDLCEQVLHRPKKKKKRILSWTPGLGSYQLSLTVFLPVPGSGVSGARCVTLWLSHGPASSSRASSLSPDQTQLQRSVLWPDTRLPASAQAEP